MCTNTTPYSDVGVSVVGAIGPVTGPGLGSWCRRTLPIRVQRVQLRVPPPPLRRVRVWDQCRISRTVCSAATRGAAVTGAHEASRGTHHALRTRTPLVFDPPVDADLVPTALNAPFLALPVGTRLSLSARSLVLRCCDGRRTGRPKGCRRAGRPKGCAKGCTRFSRSPRAPCRPCTCSCPSRVVDCERRAVRRRIPRPRLRHPARPARPAGLGVP
jgi:hypothetical protein